MTLINKSYNEIYMILGFQKSTINGYANIDFKRALLPQIKCISTYAYEPLLASRLFWCLKRL